jgi:hypothetical protein
LMDVFVWHEAQWARGRERGQDKSLRQIQRVIPRLANSLSASQL